MMNKTLKPRIINLSEKKLVGKNRTMSLANNKTGELWKDFMPSRREVQNTINTDLISLQVYPESFDFNPVTEFTKWAAVEVMTFGNIPENMEPFTLPGGLYAVFDYKGSSNDPSIFQHIFGTWLPSSEYILDNRPHFEVLGENYKNNDPESEEEIWIPVKLKTD